MRDLLRAAAGPVICAVLVTGLLAAWAGTGGGGTLTRIRLQVTQAAVPMRAFTPQAADAKRTATTFVTIRNLSGTTDELIAASSPFARRVTLTQRTGPAGTPVSVGALVIPAHGTLTLTPLGDDLSPPAAVPLRVAGHRAAHANLPPRRHRHHRRDGHRPGHPVTADTVTGTIPTTSEMTRGSQVELAVGGMTCAACAARVQARLNKLDGVTAAVNLATGRAYVFAPSTVSAPELIKVIETAGYTAQVARRTGPDAGAAAEQAAVRRLRRRLTLALVFFVPLTDLSLMLSIFPWTRFPGWQWLLVALAVPVATWAAWPFHAAALRNARHLSSSMDTLVSLGILAACGWSAYAMFVLDRGAGQPGGLKYLLHGSGGGIYLEVAASVTTFLLAGRLYEAKARQTSGQAMRDLAAASARDVCVLADDGTEQRIPAALLQAGQRFVVRPGERIAADGEVLSGQSAIDRSMMTGESVPVDAATGDAVTGGTIALTGRLVVRATRSARTPSWPA